MHATTRWSAARAKPRRSILSAVLALALVLAACGGGTDDEAEDAPEDTPTDEPSTEEPAPEEPATEEPATEEPAAEEPAADAGDGEAFYADRDLELVVPTAPGGGADAIAQFISPWITEYVEGNPQVNITYAEGGGGIAGANEFALRGEHDGSTMMLTTLSSVTNAIIGGDEVQYDFADFAAVAAFPVSGVIYVSPETGIEEPSGLIDPPVELIKGGNSPTASDVQYILALEALDVRDDIQEVWGYPGTNDHQLAFQQGETNIDGTTSTLWNESQFLVEDGLATPLIALGFPDGEGGYERDEASPDLPTVPEAYEAMYGEEISGEAWDAFRSVHGQIAVGTSLVFHVDAPEEAIQALREGLEAAATDPEYLTAAEETIGPYPPYVGEDLQIVDGIRQGIDPAVSEWVRTFLAEEYPAEVAGG